MKIVFYGVGRVGKYYSDAPIFSMACRTGDLMISILKALPLASAGYEYLCLQLDKNSALSILIDIIITIMAKDRKMQKRISALKVRQNLGQVLNEAALRGDDFIVERSGKPMAVIVSMDKYQILQENLKQLRQAAEKIRGRMKNADPGKSEALINEAVAAVRSS